MAKKNPEAEENFTLEQALTGLEKIVQQLEKGQLGLGESLERFEEGVKLYKSCRQSLDQAEKKIKILTEELKEKDWPE